MSTADRSLVWVLVALGIGVTGASLLPNSMTLSGEKLTPLGLNLNATGGAAFFVATLVFVFHVTDSGGSSAEPAAVDPASAPVTYETGAPPPVVPASTQPRDTMESAAPVTSPSPGAVQTMPDLAQLQEHEPGVHDYSQAEVEAALTLGILAAMAE